MSEKKEGEEEREEEERKGKRPSFSVIKLSSKITLPKGHFIDIVGNILLVFFKKKKWGYRKKKKKKERKWTSSHAGIFHKNLLNNRSI